MKILMISDYQLPVLGCICLFFAMCCYWISLTSTNDRFVFFEAGKILILLSNILFFVTLLSRWIGDRYFPLSNLYESLIFLSWSISSIHLFLENKTKSRVIGSISSPILFLLSGFSSLTLPIEMQKALPLVPSLQSNWLMMHVSMMMVSYATLIIGSLFSILYLACFSIGRNDSSSPSPSPVLSPAMLPSPSPVVPYRLEIGTLTYNMESNVLNKQGVGTTSKLSILELIDTWSYRIIGLGFPFLTIGIISGAVWANEAWGSYWSWDPKETWALITWLVFAIYLHSRLLKGWQGKKAAVLGSCGFFVIWICYLGVNFLGKGLHSYGWVL
jgi:cytochrome c-type biogenesis protein CcsB